MTQPQSLHARSANLAALPAPVLPYVDISPDIPSLFLPRGSWGVAPEDWARPYPGPIPAHWQEIAKAKGFRIAARLRDKNHLALECETCGGLTAQKVFTLRSAQPNCVACQHDALVETAKQAGLSFEGYHPEDRHLGLYRAPCGHRITRQFELMTRIAKGLCKHRCETCHAEKERGEAGARGWALVGADPQGDPNYRLYQHTCGHEQRIARVNMQTGRFNCEACGEGWASAPSFIYCMRFELPGLPALVKLGFSRDPHSRLTYQLKRHSDLHGEILCSIPVATGHQANCQEKKMHTELKRDHPEAVVPPVLYRPWLRVKSEIYSAEMEHVILQFLSNLQNEQAA